MRAMRAITIIQPWAHLIATGEKRVENRVSRWNYRGEIAIHAGNGRKFEGQSVVDLADNMGVDFEKLAFGAVVAVGRLVDCLPVEDIQQARRLRQSDPDKARRLVHGNEWLMDHAFCSGPYCLVLDGVKPLANPVAVRGQLGLWRLPTPTTRDVLGELLRVDVTRRAEPVAAA